MDAEGDGGDSDSDAVVDDAKHQALNAMSDLEYMRSRTRARLSDDDDDDVAGGADVDAKAMKQPPLPEPADDPPSGLPPPPPGPPAVVDDASDTGRLFIRNLAYTATEEELGELCAPFGDVASVHIPTDRATGACKGLAYVQFTDPDCAAAALRGLDKRSFQGRLLHVLPAQLKPGTGAGGEAGDGQHPGGGYKALKEAQLKASAGDTARHSTWYIRPDTVAAAMAARYGVSKTDVMEPGSSGVATRLALGEAQIVGDTKAQLTALGCDVASMDAAAAQPQGVARSRTALLIKNLPFSAEAEELEELCRRHGRDGLHRLLLPDTKALAVACFIDAQSARAAFAGLAYKRYQHVPLYVEWAPAGLIADATGAAAPAPARAAETPAHAAAKKTAGKAAPLSAAEAATATGVQGATEGGGGGGDAEDDVAVGGPAAQRTLYVKNLAWATDEAGLRAHFLAALPAGSVRSVRVAQRPGKRPGTLVSSGYGFVELSSGEHVAAALRSLDGTALDGHALKLQRSRGAGAGDDPDAAPGGAAAPRAGGGGTKLVVRNVAFEATKGDIRGLFSPFGQVKSVRLPLKFDGSHRGFAFVEMTTKTEAKAAFTAVGKTHLYGRRLVTEWAVDPDAEDDVAAARDKAARDMATHEAAAGDEAPRKRRRV
jgi:multiple RNA-binding domain-containing protein 1